MLRSINKVIKILVFSDLVLLFAWGLITPILAIFIVQSIQGGNAQVAGLAIGIYWLSKSLLQIPIAHFLDKKAGEKDDYYALIFGTLLASFVPLGFIFATLPWHIYLLQFIHALGMAFAIPSWAGIFTRHIEKGREAFCWSLDSSALGIGAGVAGIVGGTIAKTFGFLPLFLGVAILGIISALLIFFIKKEILPKEKIYPLPKPH
jgi:MFS family permease